MATNVLTISFTPPSPAPANGYIVKYRPYGSGGAYTQVMPNPTSSPVTISGLDDSVNQWEGTIESDCDGMLSTVATFVSETYCQCSPGFTANEFDTSCEKVTRVPATSTGGGTRLACHFTNPNYGQYGLTFFAPGGYNTNGTWTTGQSRHDAYGLGGSFANTLWVQTASPSTSKARLNRTGIWLCGDQDYASTPLGFSRQINVPESKTYLIGVGSDNYATLKVNGTTIVNQDPVAMSTQYIGSGGDATFPFRIWSVYPVDLVAGSNIIEMSATNTGGNGIFGCEVYDATEAQLIACTNETDLAPYIVFTTANMPGLGAGRYIADNDPFEAGNYNCTAYPGYSLIYEDGAYYCKLIEREACGGGPLET